MESAKRTLTFKVPSVCQGSQKNFNKIKAKISGVDTISYNEDEFTVTFTGPADPYTIKQQLAKITKYYELLEEKALPVSHKMAKEISTGQEPVHVMEAPPQVHAESIKEEFEDRHKHKPELKTYKKRFECDRCRESGFEERYRCEACNKDVHKICQSPKPTVSHDIFPGLVFDFSDQPTPGRFCAACGNNIYGYHYHCRAEDLDLHPSCSKLPQKLSISGMEFHIEENTTSKCRWCKQKKRNRSNIRGWSYVSSSDENRFHVYCISEMFNEAWKESAASDADQDILQALERMDWGEVVAKSKRYGGKEGHDRLAKTIMLLLKTVACVLLGDLTGILPITITAAELVSKYT